MSDATISGPVFDGRAAVALAQGARAVRDDLTGRAETLAREAFAGMIRHPTGRFEASVTSTRETRSYTTPGHRKSYTMPVVVDDPATDVVVTTDLATYGPWLEGTGSRNATTRFKGYHGFRLAAQALDTSAEARAETLMHPFVDRCNQ